MLISSAIVSYIYGCGQYSVLLLHLSDLRLALNWQCIVAIRSFMVELHMNSQQHRHCQTFDTKIIKYYNNVCCDE